MIHHWFNELVTVSVANEKQADPSSLKKKKEKNHLGRRRGRPAWSPAGWRGAVWGPAVWWRRVPSWPASAAPSAPPNCSPFRRPPERAARTVADKNRLSETKKWRDDTKQFSRRCMVALSQSSLVRSTLIGWYWRHSSSRVNELQWNRYTSTVCHFVATGLFCGSNIQC